MFDPKKLEEFLAALEVETHSPNHAPSKIIQPLMPRLKALMDKYSLEELSEYLNIGTDEFPLLAKKPRYSFPVTSSGQMKMASNVYYSGNAPSQPQRYQSYASLMGVTRNTEAPSSTSPKHSPESILQSKVAKLDKVSPAKIADPTPAQPEKSPDYMHTLTAWRGWAIYAHTLCSLGVDAQWEPKKATKVRCVHKSHHPPQMTCTCGFWSFKSLDLLTQALNGGYADVVKVIGTVEIWGRVIECEKGFRSEYAYPKELWLLEDGLEYLSWEYGVPVRKFS